MQYLAIAVYVATGNVQGRTIHHVHRYRCSAVVMFFATRVGCQPRTDREFLADQESTRQVTATPGMISWQRSDNFPCIRPGIQYHTSEAQQVAALNRAKRLAQICEAM
jgi:hypothetical protein